MLKNRNVCGKGINSTGLRITLIHTILATFCVGLVLAPFFVSGAIAETAPHLMLAATGIILTAILMAWISRRISGPIRQLTDVAEKIAAGDLKVSVPVNCRCDIGGLAASIRTMVKRLQVSNAEIIELANHDPVTGLSNRQHFNELLTRRLEAGSDRDVASGHVFFIEVLGMREVNDRFGHDAADALLAEIVRKLTAIITELTAHVGNGAGARPVLARFGGEQLVLDLPCEALQPDHNAVPAFAAALHGVLKDGIQSAGRLFRPQMSIGIASYPDQATSAAKIKQYAALACNSALNSLKLEKTAFFHAGMMQAIKTREKMERDLRSAIEARRFEVHYQPKVNTGDWSLTGVEALVRMNHPERGIVGPGEFIPIAEMTGLICDIGHIVLQDAIAQCALWAQSGQSTEVSVNVSPEQFNQPGFSDQVIELLRQHGCPPQLLTIEITETLATTNVAEVAAHIAALRAEGVQTAIDDFGTGYSNLMQLTGLKFDILKVDRSFISQIQNEGTAREVSRAIIQLGRNLGCRIVAEGAETPGQVAIAAKLGCDEIQGFYFSRPLSRSDFESWRDLRSTNPVATATEGWGEPEAATTAA
ncbi:putative bifunctional diguanylate cyclase/phosphodiesterase [Hoeflea sp.]|uniref:putative bifunctional diguanylate cyclase/phosphodiesterase n=1 Tax=Hoeflea sp. TaxID=1940281 RepID=UPI003B52B203